MEKFLINKKRENHPSTITIEQPMSASYSEVDILQSKQPRCNPGPETAEIIEMDCISPEEDMEIPIEQQKTEKKKKYAHKYRSEWKHCEEFKSWLEESCCGDLAMMLRNTEVVDGGYLQEIIKQYHSSFHKYTEDVEEDVIFEGTIEDIGDFCMSPSTSRQSSLSRQTQSSLTCQDENETKKGAKRKKQQ
ncbi:hypothetical protein RN001_005758 [Aquatica leii]|uniref:Uncharacterized protein n=1 Tax=Aquatica leii TaxID=1421715 RepID=A0AAN7Q0Q5_9COLE|nr:hypothetical protein RN001_005758 [Aquatica leii]